MIVKLFVPRKLTNYVENFVRSCGSRFSQVVMLKSGLLPFHLEWTWVTSSHKLKVFFNFSHFGVRFEVLVLLTLLYILLCCWYVVLSCQILLFHHQHKGLHLVLHHICIAFTKLKFDVLCYAAKKEIDIGEYNFSQATLEQVGVSVTICTLWVMVIH